MLPVVDMLDKGVLSCVYMIYSVGFPRWFTSNTFLIKYI